MASGGAFLLVNALSIQGQGDGPALLMIPPNDAAR
jgi:hypothetical protein